MTVGGDGWVRVECTLKITGRKRKCRLQKPRKTGYRVGAGTKRRNEQKSEREKRGYRSSRRQVPFFNLR